MLGQARFAALDPRGIWRESDVLAVCESGQCVRVNAGAGRAGVYVLHPENGVAWITAAAGEGAGNLSRLGLGAVEAHVAGDCSAVAFMTARRGMVLRAARAGYAVTGWVLKKELNDGRRR